MKKPLIGVPTRYHEKSESVGQIRHYLDAILWAGGLPLMIPLVCGAEAVREYVEQIDGVLLPGSPTDIDPASYGAEPHPKLGRIYPDRENADFTLLECADKFDLPLMGICFGVQSLNVYRGGSLVQDIPAQVSNPIQHNEGVRHLVRVAEDSLIGRLAGKSEVAIVSDHHQSIENVGRNLRSVAFAPDGVVEAVEDSTGRFIVGVQWHPERGWQQDPLSKALFQALIEQAQKRKSRGHPV
jgi:putative glutamine amidotransferase